MVDTFKSPDTFFAILGTVKKLEENFKKINEEIYAKFGSEPEENIDYKMSYLSQSRTVALAQLLYWKEELYAQFNNN